MEACGENNYAYELLCWYTPEYSPLFRQFVAGFHGAQNNMLPFALWCGLTSLLLGFLLIEKTYQRAKDELNGSFG